MRCGGLAAPVIWRLRSSIHTVYPNSVIRRNRLVAIASLAAPVAGGGVTSLAALPGFTRGPASESPLDCGADVPGTARFGGAGHGQAAGERRAQSSRPDWTVMKLEVPQPSETPTPAVPEAPTVPAPEPPPEGPPGGPEPSTVPAPNDPTQPIAPPEPDQTPDVDPARETPIEPPAAPPTDQAEAPRFDANLAGPQAEVPVPPDPLPADAGSGFPSRCLSPSRRRSPCRAPDGRHDEEPRDGLSAPAVAQAGRPQTEE